MSLTVTPTMVTTPVRAGVAPTLYAIRGIRDYLAEHPGQRVAFRKEPPLPVDFDASLRLLQAQLVERLAYLFSISSYEFLTWRAVLGLTYWYGEPALSERAADAIDAIERELIQ